MKAYVICMNDMVMAVVLDSPEIARFRMNRMAHKYYADHKGQFNYDWQSYNATAHWNIQVTEVVNAT